MRKIEYIPAQDLLKKLNSVDDINIKVKLSKKIVDSINDTFLKDWEANTYIITDVVHNHLSNFWKEREKKWGYINKNRSESEIIRDDKLYYHRIAELEEATRRMHLFSATYSKGDSLNVYESLEQDMNAARETENLVTARAESALADFLYLLKDSDYDTYNKVFKANTGCLPVLILIVVPASALLILF